MLLELTPAMTDLPAKRLDVREARKSRLSIAAVNPHLEAPGCAGSAIVNGNEGGGLLEEPVESRCALNEDMVVSRQFDERRSGY